MYEAFSNLIINKVVSSWEILISILPMGGVISRRNKKGSFEATELLVGKHCFSDVGARVKTLTFRKSREVPISWGKRDDERTGPSVGSPHTPAALEARGDWGLHELGLWLARWLARHSDRAWSALSCVKLVAPPRTNHESAARPRAAVEQLPLTSPPRRPLQRASSIKGGS